MDSARKLQFWDLLLECGFKEIEVAFPSASQTDFNFVRQLIDEQRIPEDVTIQVLTQARDPLILRTFEALRGARQATVHLYNATAPLFRELVFGMDKAEVIALATRATRLIRQQCEQQPETRWQYEYSPETFCFTEPEFALEICEAVADVWQPCAERPMIVNLPATVEVNTPNVYADQIEYFCRHFSCNQIPVHPRHPWAGSLAYTAFSGSHQDAIKKGFDARQPGDPWQMPYLPIDPQDIGCSYEAVIRVNSQSGKSGSAWLIEQNHGLKLPRGLQQDFSQHVQQVTDSDGKEMTHHALWQLFRTRYGLLAQPALTLLDYQSASQQDGQLSLQATLRHHGETRRLQGQGNGLLSAAASGLSALLRQPFMIKDYHEHTLGARSDSRSVAYIRCVFPQGESYWGVGIDNDVARASLQALCNAISVADQVEGRK